MCINYRYKYWYIILYRFLHSEKQYAGGEVSQCVVGIMTRSVFVENVPSFHWYFSPHRVHMTILFCLHCALSVRLLFLQDFFSCFSKCLVWASRHIRASRTLFFSSNTALCLLHETSSLCFCRIYRVNCIYLLSWCDFVACICFVALIFHSSTIRIWTSSFVIHYIREVAPFEKKQFEPFERWRPHQFMSWWG